MYKLIGVTAICDHWYRRARLTAGAVWIAGLLGGNWAATADNLVRLRPEQAQDGHVVSLPSGATGVNHLASTNTYRWTLDPPLTNGWWRVKVDLAPNVQHETHQALFLGTVTAPWLALSGIASQPATPTTQEFWFYAATPIRYVAVQRFAAPGNPSLPVAGIELQSVSPTFKYTDWILVDFGLNIHPHGPLPSLLSGSYEVHAGWAQTNRPLALVWTETEGRQSRIPLKENLFITTGNSLTEMNVVGPTLWSGLSALRKPALPALTPISAHPYTPLSPLLTEAPESFLVEINGHDLTAAAVRLATLPYGHHQAIITSWDDGPDTDIRLAELLAKHGYVGTFFLKGGRPTAERIRSAWRLEKLGMEIGAHTLTHPMLRYCNPERVREEVFGIRRELEQLMDHPILSFAYPYGIFEAYDNTGNYIVNAVKDAGYWSARSTVVREATIHQAGADLEFPVSVYLTVAKAGIDADLAQRWTQLKTIEGGLFHWWGHAWEIRDWDWLEQVLVRYAHQPGVWYATQGEVFVWRWLGANLKIIVLEATPNHLKLQLLRPRLEAHLPRLPVTLSLPEGATALSVNGQPVGLTHHFAVLP